MELQNLNPEINEAMSDHPISGVGEWFLDIRQPQLPGMLWLVGVTDQWSRMVITLQVVESPSILVIEGVLNTLIDRLGRPSAISCDSNLPVNLGGFRQWSKRKGITLRVIGARGPVLKGRLESLFTTLQIERPRIGAARVNRSRCAESNAGSR